MNVYASRPPHHANACSAVVTLGTGSYWKWEGNERVAVDEVLFGIVEMCHGELGGETTELPDAPVCPTAHVDDRGVLQHDACIHDGNVRVDDAEKPPRCRLVDEE